MRYRRFGNHVIVTYLELCEEDFKLLLGLLRSIGFEGSMVEEPISPGNCPYAVRDNAGIWMCLKNENAPSLCPGINLCPYVLEKYEKRGLDYGR
jgi:hypothetical protein